MTLNAVVLPAPFGPMRPEICPFSTSNDTPSRATMPPKRKRDVPYLEKGHPHETLNGPDARWQRALPQRGREPVARA